VAKANVICENCRAANHRECLAPLLLSITRDGRVKNSNYVCCDNVLGWVDKSIIQNPVKEEEDEDGEKKKP
jgi:hypothetical protein